MTKLDLENWDSLARDVITAKLREEFKNPGKLTLELRAEIERQKEITRLGEEQRRLLKELEEKEKGRYTTQEWVEECKRMMLEEAKRWAEKREKEMYDPKNYEDYGGSYFYAKGEDMPPKRVLKGSFGAKDSAIVKKMEEHMILRATAAVGGTHTIYISTPGQSFGLDANAETYKIENYHNLRKFVVEATKGLHLWLWEPDTIISFKNTYGEWLMELREAVRKKDREEINLTLTNMHLEWWKEKGLLAA